MGIGSGLLNFIGAVVRWLYGTIWRSIAGRDKFTFNEYLNGPKDGDAIFDTMEHEFVNKIVGMITLMLLCFTIIKLGL